jgi:CBS domain-containing protein
MMKVSEFMTGNPTCVLRSDNIRDAARKMLDENVGALPVVADHTTRELVGMVTDRDIAVRAVALGLDGSTTVDQIMTRDHLVTATADDKAKEIMNAMADHQVRRIPVLDASHHVIGIVAQADIARRMDKESRTGAMVEEISKPGGKHTQ